MSARVRALAQVFAILGVLCGSARDSRAYTPTLTQSGTPVRWQGSFKLPLAGNPVNRSGLDHQSFFQAVVRSLQRWKAASGSGADFDYWQGTDPAVFEPNSNYNGLSSVYFASNGTTPVSSNVLGLTQVWYNTDSGQILETDIILNDINYRFTTDPKDTTGFGGVMPVSGLARNVFIENVLTHELGHAFGLSHSGGLQSTMLFMESPEQAYLGCDEQVGINAVYPGHTGGARAAVTGVVLGPDRKPVFGAHVVAVSRRRGTALATTMSDRFGRYVFRALEPGDYYLMAEPFYAGAAALPAYYTGMNPNLCSGEAFSRTVLTDASNIPVAVSAPAGGTLSAPAIQVRCDFAGAAVSSLSSALSVGTAPVIYDGRGSGFGVADRLASGTAYYQLHSVSGSLEVHSLAYSLYSPVHTTLKLLDESGNDLSAQESDAVYRGLSGYVNYDSALVARNLPPGDYIVAVSSSVLNRSQYPAGPVSVDSVPFMLLTGSINEGQPPLSGEIAFNGRCRMTEEFAAYVSPPGPPRRSSLEDQGKTGFCGTLSYPGGKPPPAGPGQIVSWLLPWLFMLASVRVIRVLQAACPGGRQKLPWKACKPAIC